MAKEKELGVFSCPCLHLTPISAQCLVLLDMEERCLCVAGASLAFLEAAVWQDTHEIEQEEGLSQGRHRPTLYPGQKVPHSRRRTSALGLGDGPWMGIRAGRYDCSQELRACLLYSTNHRLLGLSALVYTKLQVYLCSLAGTSTLSAFLSNSQGVEGSLFCLGRGQTPEASDSS